MNYLIKIFGLLLTSWLFIGCFSPVASDSNDPVILVEQAVEAETTAIAENSVLNAPVDSVFHVILGDSGKYKICDNDTILIEEVTHNGNDTLVWIVDKRLNSVFIFEGAEDTVISGQRYYDNKGYNIILVHVDHYADTVFREPFGIILADEKINGYKQYIEEKNPFLDYKMY